MENEVLVLIPIFALLSAAAVVIFAIVFRSRHHMQEREMLNRERMCALEKGINLPILETPKVASTGSALQGGLVCIAVGLGLSIFFYMIATKMMAIGVLVMLIGAANLVFWQLAGKKEWEARVQWQQSVGQAYLNYLAQLSAKVEAETAAVRLVKSGVTDGQ